MDVLWLEQTAFFHFTANARVFSVSMQNVSRNSLYNIEFAPPPPPP
jgi:hypothetical protein